MNSDCGKVESIYGKVNEQEKAGKVFNLSTAHHLSYSLFYNKRKNKMNIM